MDNEVLMWHRKFKRTLRNTTNFSEFNVRGLDGERMENRSDLLAQIVEAMQEEHKAEEIVNSMWLQKQLLTLEEEHAVILYQYYYNDKTQEQIGKMLGYQQSYISRKLRLIVKELTQLYKQDAGILSAASF